MLSRPSCAARCRFSPGADPARSGENSSASVMAWCGSSSLATSKGDDEEAVLVKEDETTYTRVSRVEKMETRESMAYDIALLVGIVAACPIFDAIGVAEGWVSLRSSMR